jgi:hypothetical protein
MPIIFWAKEYRALHALACASVRSGAPVSALAPVPDLARDEALA